MDAVFLHTESATQYMHTLKIAIYDPPHDGRPYSFADQFAHIGTTIHRAPPFRWRALLTAHPRYEYTRFTRQYWI